MAAENESPTRINPKIAGSPVGAAVVVIIAWLAALAGVEIPSEVQQALTALVGLAVGWFIRGS